VMHFSFFDVSARFDHLKPAKILDGFVSALNRLFNGVPNGGGRSAGKFDEFVNVIFHI